MKQGTDAIGRLQRVSSELLELHRDFEGSDVEAEILIIFREVVTQTRETVSVLLDVIGNLRLPGKNGALARLLEERMLRACELNGRIAAALDAGQIRTDHEGLSVYLLLLNQTLDRFDHIFKNLKIET